MTAVEDRVVKKALSTLDNMKTIAENEMLIRGTYVDTVVVNDDLRGAPCGGHRACLIGSMFLAHDPVPKVLRRKEGERQLGELFDSMAPSNRVFWMESRPALRLVYDTMDEIAAKKIDRSSVWNSDENWSARHAVNEFDSPAEAYFEIGAAPWRWADEKPKVRIPQDVIKLIEQTRTKIEKLAA
jgi:hypothetical protein